MLESGSKINAASEERKREKEGRRTNEEREKGREGKIKGRDDKRILKRTPRF